MNRQQLLDLYFLEARSKLIDLAAFLDRLERSSGTPDFRLNALVKAVDELHDANGDRTERVLMSLSDPTATRFRPRPPRQLVAHGLGKTERYALHRTPRPHGQPGRRMITRMARPGVPAICEPAFWAGFDRSSADGFYDYFCQLTEHEPKRAAKFGLPHYSWLCINPKESEDVKLAEEVIGIIPKFLDRPNVLGIGEIGLNKNSRNEMRVLEMHVDLAARQDQLILVHTPHLEDKLKGTRLILDAFRSDKRIRPERVIIDHVEEHTVKMVLDAGFWAGMTLYPETKCTAARASRHAGGLRQRTHLDEQRLRLGRERAAGGAKRRARNASPRPRPKAIDRMVYGNPVQFLGQNPRFALADAKQG